MNGSQDAYMSTVAILVFVISLYIRDGQECKMARDKNVLLIQPIEKKNSWRRIWARFGSTGWITDNWGGFNRPVPREIRFELPDVSIRSFPFFHFGPLHFWNYIYLCQAFSPGRLPCLFSACADQGLCCAFTLVYIAMDGSTRLDNHGLHRAALLGDDEGVLYALQSGADVNSVDEAGRTVIMCVVAGEK
jgi:hypothetical protein